MLTKQKEFKLITEEIGHEIICNIYPLLEPEPYMGEIVKHQQHDQQSHGNWADSGQSADNETTSTNYSEAEVNAVADYIQDGYFLTNKWLRKKDFLPPGDKKTLERTEPAKVRMLDSVFEKTLPSEKEQTVYRGVSGEVAIKLRNTEIGSSFVDKGYVSTSGMKNIADAFVTVGNQGSATAVLSINVPKGTKVFSVPKMFALRPGFPTGAMLELERILPRGTRFEVVGKTDEVVELKVVSSE
jgi:hypothetical protein